jgi:hypothetical protein
MSNALFALATAYRTIYTVAGGYITARLALSCRPATATARQARPPLHREGAVNDHGYSFSFS